MNKYERALKQLILGTQGYVDKKMESLAFDITVDGKITNNSGTTYSILINKVTHTCNRKLSNITINIGDVVVVRVPRGNWNRIFIEGKIG